MFAGHVTSRPGTFGGFCSFEGINEAHLKQFTLNLGINVKAFHSET